MIRQKMGLSQAAQSRQPCVNSHQLSQWEALGTVILTPLELEKELQYHGLAMRDNSAYDACISCENFLKFGSVTPELTGLI